MVLLFFVCLLTRLLKYHTVVQKALGLVLNAAEARVLAHRFLVSIPGIPEGDKNVKSLMSSVLGIS